MARKRFTEDWGLFEWACVGVTTIVLGGVLVAVFLTLRAFPGEAQTGFENAVETYLETRSRYRHSLDWRGEVKSVRCAETETDYSFHGCDMRFAKVGNERWSGGHSSVGAFHLRPCPRRLGTHALSERVTPCNIAIDD